MSDYREPYLPPFPFRRLPLGDGMASVRTHWRHLVDSGSIEFCDRLAAMMKILVPLVNARRHIGWFDIAEILCDLRLEATYGAVGCPTHPRIPDEYRSITLPFRNMLAAEIQILANACVLALREHFGPQWKCPDDHAAQADRDRVYNKVMVQIAAERQITAKMAPGIDDVPGLMCTDFVWVWRASRIARALRLPLSVNGSRLLEYLPLSVRDPDYDERGQYVGRGRGWRLIREDRPAREAPPVSW